MQSVENPLTKERNSDIGGTAAIPITKHQFLGGQLTESFPWRLLRSSCFFQLLYIYRRELGRFGAGSVVCVCLQ